LHFVSSWLKSPVPDSFACKEYAAITLEVMFDSAHCPNEMGVHDLKNKPSLSIAQFDQVF